MSWQARLHTDPETADNPAMRPSEALAACRDRVLAIVAAHGAKKVHVFSSALRGEDRSDSDLDLLIDTPPGTSLLKVVGIKLAIEEARGVPIDLCTDRDLHPDLRDRILAEARPLSGALFVPCAISSRPAARRHRRSEARRRKPGSPRTASLWAHQVSPNQLRIRLAAAATANRNCAF
jgi:predicted nucleotidyltransferase